MPKIKINGEYFTKKMNPEMDVLISEEHNSVGLQVYVSYKRNKVYITLSSKMLAGDYMEKINITNLREVYKKVSKVIEISPYCFYRLTPIYLEVVSDIKWYDVPMAVEVLYFLSKFQTEYKPSPKMYKSNYEPTSFALVRNVLSRISSDYVSIYSKYNELFRSSKQENAAFLNTLDEQQIEGLKAYCNDVLRVDKIPSKSRIRAVFGCQTKDFNLYNMLTSPRNVNAEMMERIFGNEHLEKDSRGSVSHKKFDKLSSLKLYDYDLDLIYAEYQAMGGEMQKSKYLRPYKEVMYDLARQNDDEKIILVKQLKQLVTW